MSGAWFSIGGLAVALAVSVDASAADRIVGQVKGDRSDNGLIVSGSIKGLPPATKIWIELVAWPGHPKVASAGPTDDNVVLGPDGTFRSTTLSLPSFALLPAGHYRAKVTSFFNSGWQSLDVLKAAGVELDSKGRSDITTKPTALPDSPDFVPDDPEFPKAGRHLETIRDFDLQPPAQDVAAIEAVKHTTLVVQGSGRSSMPVGESVDFFAKAPGFKITGWSALQDAGKWVVTLDCMDGEKPSKAQWSYDPKTKAVKYLDPLAKTLSYVPPD